jgi:tripartite-type tricarboxylate transporter receptor subunit TctC
MFAALVAGAAAGAAHAQSSGGSPGGFPNRPLRLVVPFPPGGASDTSARLIAAKLGERLGQPVVVENRPGATGNIATNAVVRGPADGYQMLLGAAFLSVNPWLYKNAGYDPVRDLAPLGRPIDSRVVLVGRPDLPALAALIEQAKRTNTPIRLASPGAGTLSHLAGELLRLRTGAPMIHVPYKGSVAALTDMAGQQVDVMFDAVVSAAPMIRGGRIKAIAVPETARNPQMPEVPTLAELGVPDIVIRAWNTVFVPAGTPTEVQQTLHAHVDAVLATPAVADELRLKGLEVAGPTAPRDFVERLRTESELWRRTVQAAGISLE